MEIGSIDSRYLENVENKGTVLSLPVIVQLIKVCGLPVERYFNPEVMQEESAQRKCFSHKLKLCPEQYSTVIEGALDGALKAKESTDETEGVWKYPLFSFFRVVLPPFSFWKSRMCGQRKVFLVLYLRWKERKASTASVASLAKFCFREPLPLNAKSLVGIVQTLIQKGLRSPTENYKCPSSYMAG